MTPVANETAERHYVKLLADVASGTQELVSAHAVQMVEEVKGEADRATYVVGIMSAAGTLMAIGFVFIVFSFAQLLQDRLGFTETAALAITGVTTIAVGFLMLGIARHQLLLVRWLPSKSLQSFSESLSWITRR